MQAQTELSFPFVHKFPLQSPYFAELSEDLTEPWCCLMCTPTLPTESVRHIRKNKPSCIGECQQLKDANAS